MLFGSVELSGNTNVEDGFEKLPANFIFLALKEVDDAVELIVRFPPISASCIKLNDPPVLTTIKFPNLLDPVMFPSKVCIAEF